jgi:polysaccharide export outer membrane protein
LLAGCASSVTHTAVPLPEPALGPEPGDVVRVRIWREPDLSGDFVVEADDSVVLPLLGRVEAAGTASDTLVDQLIEAYARYLRNPSIQITVLRRVAVQGEVRSPGLYPVDATVSLADVLALAGGLTPNANPKKIYLLRNGVAVDVGLTPETVIERSPVRSGDQILVSQKSWFSRNSGIIVGATISAIAIIIAGVN